MPLPIDPTSAAVAATQFGQNALNAVLTGKTNRKNRKFAEKMANQSRQWALDDWNMANEYNSPANQMQRYKAAGLNPHLIYGQANTAPAVRSSEMASYQGKAPQIDLDPSAVMSSYYDAQIKPIQTDNLAKQGLILQAEYELKKAQTTDVLASAAQKGVNTDAAQLQFGIESELKPYTLEKRKLDVDQAAANLKFTLNQDERATLKNHSDIAAAAEAILTSRAQREKIPLEKDKLRAEIANLIRGGKLQDISVDLQSKGIMPNDSAAVRYIEQFLQSDPVSSFFKRGYDGWNKKIASPVKDWLRKQRNSSANDPSNYKPYNKY